MSDNRVIQLKDARATLHFPGGKKVFAAPMGVSPHGGHLAYSRNGDRALVIRSLVDGYVRRVPGFIVPPGRVTLTVSPLGHFVGLREQKADAPLRIANTLTGAVSTLPPQWSIISFTPDASRMLVHTDGYGDEVAVYDLRTSTVVRRIGPAHALSGDGDTLATRIVDGGTWITFTSLSKGTEVRPRIPVPTHNVYLAWNRSGTLTMRLAVVKGPWRNYSAYDRWVFDPRTGKTRKADRVVIPRGLRAHRVAGFS
ncbi:hypothetical protein [Nonomuraea insulae]|uniref:Protein TolB n=1 Tax=Nonomuraea insulae TaxID=1616787 RepID=A0ABW1D8S6_9ACTN